MATNAGFVGRAQLLRDLRAYNRSVRAAVHAEVATDSWDIANEGAKDIGYTIMNTRSAFVKNKDNRSMTGLMISSTDSYAQRRGNYYTLVAGWIDRKEKYFAIQDQGGVGYGQFEGQIVWGMEALRSARLTMADEAHKRGYEIQ